jgi:hypothetical protein
MRVGARGCGGNDRGGQEIFVDKRGTTMKLSMKERRVGGGGGGGGEGIRSDDEGGGAREKREKGRRRGDERKTRNTAKPISQGPAAAANRGARAARDGFG